MSMKTFFYNEPDESLKSKVQVKDSTILQKYLMSNHATTPNKTCSPGGKPPPSLSSSEKKRQSKLPISIKQTQNLNLNSQSKPQEKSNSDISKNESKVTFLDAPKIIKNSNLDKDESTSSDDDLKLSRLNEMVNRFKNSKPFVSSKRFSNEKLPYWSSNRNDSGEESENDDSTVTEVNENELSVTSRNESETEIAILKNRLLNLRKKLFSNTNQSISSDLSNYETHINNDEYDETNNKSKKIFNNKNNKKTTEFELTKKKSNPSSYYSNKITIESIDLKAKELIEKSESSLSDKIISSDGLGSSVNSSSSSIMSTVSSNFKEAQPYKPEFLKYLENKNKQGFSRETGEPLKPEDDILYQWRLRRKLEETIKQNDTNVIKTESISITSTSLAQMNPTKHNETEKKVSSETQTRIGIDSSVQTSFQDFSAQVFCKKSNIKSKNELKLNENQDEIELFMNDENEEEPTRDNSNILDVALIVSNKKPNYSDSSSASDREIKVKTKKKSNFSSSSPIKSNQPQNLINMSADLTKVSSINDNTPIYTHVNLPRTSNSSPVNFNSRLKENKKIQQSKTSSIPSTLTSISSSLTNISLQSQQLAIKTNSEECEKMNKQAISIICENKANENDSKSTEDRDEFYVQFDAHKELIESDDILRILFKKSIFYKLKLKQIDEFITN